MRPEAEVTAEAIEAVEPTPEAELSLLEFLQSLEALGDLDVSREPDYGRDVEFRCGVLWTGPSSDAPATSSS